MKHNKIYEEVERLAKEQKLMEKHYGVKSFADGHPYFTTSQETDIKEMISEGMESEEIISVIKQW